MKTFANFLKIIAVGVIITTFFACEIEKKPSCYNNHNCFHRLTPDKEGMLFQSCGDVKCDAAKASRETDYGNPRSGYCDCR